jgi:hypothetical protein
MILHLDQDVKSWNGKINANQNLIHGSIWSYLFWSEQIRSPSSFLSSFSSFSEIR